MRASGATSVSGSEAEGVGGAVVTRWPAAAVTETIANLGSTASLYVSSTRGGALFVITLADGDVCKSAACAHAAAGATAASRAATASETTRRRGVTRAASLR